MLKIEKINADWKEAKNVCRATVNKEPTNKEPSKPFRLKFLISEHSPIRLITVKWRWIGIKSWVSVHFSRHWLGWDKWVSTQRIDRTGVDRNKSQQDTPVNMTVNANAQALINVARWRLCFQASPETREEMEKLKEELFNQGQAELARVMQPNCVYRGGCPEFESCGYWNKVLQEMEEPEEITDIERRYVAADRVFEERRKK